METFDVVVIGAGSAGCALAARLSEERSCRVLLLEAGGRDRHWNIQVPAAFSWLFRSSCDWNYETEPEPHLNARRLYWPRGKVLGGSSSINAMIYIRGHPSDYDEWERLGNRGWSFADVLPYFKRAEDNTRGAGAYHGAGGPLRVSDLLCPNALSRLFLEACQEVGLSLNDDFNGAVQDGAGFYQVTQRRGQRASAAQAYLAPARSRRNLTVVTGAHVRRVEIGGARAVGVDYRHGARAAGARAGEVVLCGGAVNSPQLLLLSGVGPARHLEEHRVPVVLDLPGVGENLQDYPMAGVCCACSDRRTLDSAPSCGDVIQYLFRRTGRLTSNVGEAGAFVRTSEALPTPDVQLHFAPAFYVQHGFVRPKGAGFSIATTVLRPRSRGHIRLRSPHFNDAPLIRANYYAEPADLATQLAGLKLVRRIAHANAFAKVRLREHLPGDDARDDAALTRHLRDQTETLYHPVGTCKMGRDPLAVVDERLHVHGVQGLRVVDASVMPTLIGGNTNAPTIMIAEKAADLILGRSPPVEKPA
jgi:choline dehydrogenase